jgi:glycosyltransferase A (GT-A) superfamily protein (DUF2064 family)
MERLLVLFARAPESEARDKGLPREPSAALFAAIAREWRTAAHVVGARLAVSAPLEDFPGWRRAMPRSADVLWLDQRGRTFAARLQDAALRASRLARNVVLTGGDVVPSRSALSAAFRALDSGAEAAIAPAPDGGISLLAVPVDADLLREVGRRRRDVFRRLYRRLLSRGRAIAIVHPVPDVDGRSSLRRTAVMPRLRELVASVRCSCRIVPLTDRRERPFLTAPSKDPVAPRGPPLAA